MNKYVAPRKSAATGRAVEQCLAGRQHIPGDYVIQRHTAGRVARRQIYEAQIPVVFDICSAVEYQVSKWTAPRWERIIQTNRVADKGIVSKIENAGVPCVRQP